MDRQPGERPRGRRGAGARVPSGLALLASLLCVGLAAGSLMLALLNGRTPGEILVDEGIVGIAILTVAFSVVGALIASHRPENAIGWVFCAAALFQGLAICGYEYATYALVTEPGALPLGAEASWLGNWIWAPGLGLILVFLPLLFPNGRLLSRRWWWVGCLGGLSVGVITISALVLLWPERGVALLRESPSGEGSPQWLLLLVVEAVAFPLMLLAGLAAVISLFARFRRARGDERQQIKWFAYATAVSLIWVFLLEGIPDVNRIFEAVIAVLGLFVIPSIPVAAGIAIFRYHLYNIDRIINRTLVYGLRDLRRRDLLDAGTLPRAYGAGDAAGDSGLYAGDSRVVRPAAAAHAGLYRPPLLPREVRRAGDAGGLLGQAARRDGPRSPGRGPRGGGGGDGAAGTRPAVAVPPGPGRG